MIFVGVDPGKTGAIAAIDAEADPGDDAGVRLWPMPVIKARRGRPEYDLGEIASLLRELAEATLVFVTLEKGQAYPETVGTRHMGGGIANYQRGLGRGIFEGLLVGLGVSYQLVHPKTWQKVMLDGTSGTDTKQRAIIAAQRLLPGVELRRSERARKPDEGMVDAALLALYGARTHAELATDPENRPYSLRELDSLSRR